MDVSRGEHLKIWLDISLPALPCAGEPCFIASDLGVSTFLYISWRQTPADLRCAAAISLDAIDVSGSHDDDETFSLAHNGEIHKIRLNADGSRKGLGEYIAPKQHWGPFMLRRPQEVSCRQHILYMLRLQGSCSWLPCRIVMQ